MILKSNLFIWDEYIVYGKIVWKRVLKHWLVILIVAVVLGGIVCLKDIMASC